MTRRSIVGAGAQGRVVLEMWRAQWPDDEFVILDDDASCHGTQLLGAPVIGGTATARLDDGETVIALGHNPQRLALADRLAERGACFGTVVHPSAVVSPSARLGVGTVVFAGAVVNTEASIGAHVIVNTAALVEHDCLVGDGVSLGPGTRMGGRATIGTEAFLSTGVTLGARAVVGAGSVVGAGAVVIGEIAPRTLAYGVPARAVREVTVDFDYQRLL